MAAPASISLEVVVTIVSVDRTDIFARRLIRDWGWSVPVTTARRVSPCPRPDCGGSILVMGEGDPRCLLCARDDGRETEAELARETELVELMTTPL